MSHEPTVEVMLFAATGDEALAEAFGRVERFRLTVVESVDAALEQLQDGEVPPPQLLLVEFEGDGDGMDLLRAVKDDATLRLLPVITIGDSPDACELSYDQRANAHVERPADAAGFDDAVERIESFWTRAATLPSVTNDS
jgi:DNA-binding response OmpR family regulator